VRACPEGDPREILGERTEVQRLACAQCLACAEVCPSRAIEVVGKPLTVDEVVNEAVKDRVFYEETGGGVTLSGGEPLLFPEFSAELLGQLRALCIHTCVETSGAVPLANCLAVLPAVELFLWDLKHTDAKAHRQFTGGDLDRVLTNLHELDRRGARLVLRCPLVHTLNADPAHIDRVIKVFRGLENGVAVELLPYHEFGLSKAERLGRSDRRHPDWQLPEGMLDAFRQRVRAAGVWCVDDEVGWPDTVFGADVCCGGEEGGR
jgi:pyruvate formate lyase activating enzyme